MSRSPPSPARRAGWGVAIAATLGMSVSYIDRQTLAAIAPAVRSALTINHTQFGWLVAAFSMAYLVGAPAAGIMVDKLGARRGFAVAVVLWSLVAGAHAFASSFATLFALRVLLGTAESPSFPAAAQAIRRCLPGARRPTAYGMLFTGSSIGAMIAAPLAILLEARYGFRFAFVGTAAAGTLWIPFWLFMTRGDRLRAEAAPVHAVEAPPSASWLDVVRSAVVLRALVAVIGAAPTVMFVQTWTSQYLVERWTLPRSGISGYLLVPPLLFDVGAVGFGWLASMRETQGSDDAPKTHRDLILVAASLAAMLALAPLAPSPGVAMAFFGAAACGGGGVYVIVTADMLSRIPVGRTSSAGGMTAAAQSLALIAANPLIGLTIDLTHGYGVATVTLGLAVLPTSLAFVLWPTARKR
ncbi:hypothetical protein BH11MYX4_BH11MYX4_14600 [soil metagenome]